MVLVHGAFADASSRNGVVKLLGHDGPPVTAPANPPRGLNSGSACLFPSAGCHTRGMVTSSSTGGSSSWRRLPVAAKQRSRTAWGVTSRRRKFLKNGGL